MRLLNCSLSSSLPITGRLEPLGLHELRRIKREKDTEDEIEFGDENDNLMEGVQVKRDTKLVVANMELRFEIVDNEIIVPITTRSKSYYTLTANFSSIKLT